MRTASPRRASRLACFLIATILGGAAPALADIKAQPVAGHTQQGNHQKHGGEQAANHDQPSIPPGEAARRASRRYGGRVLNVTLEQGPDGPYYRVMLLDGGRVRVVRIDAGH